TPTANSATITRVQRRASVRYTSSPVRSQRHSAKSTSAGNAIAKQTSGMCATNDRLCIWRASNTCAASVITRASAWADLPPSRREWLAHLDNRAQAPAERKTVRPLVFRGRSDAGSIVEIRGRRDELDVEIDGTLVERIAAEVDFAVGRPPVHFHVNGSVFGEIFDAPDDALDALASFRESGGAPPSA